jgi:hypothetical protein
MMRTIKFILLITILHFKGLEKSKGDVGEKNRALFYLFNRVLALQMKVCHSRMSK